MKRVLNRENKMLEKLEVIDQIGILRDGTLQVRKANLIMEDGKEIAKTYHRYVLHPGTDLNRQNERIIAVADAVWTAEVIAAYEEAHPPPEEEPPEDDEQ